MPLFPEITPYATDMLPVGQGHTLYVEQCGNPKGLPVVVLHGGPGGGCSEKSRRYANPETTRIICFDQRGAGRSTAKTDILRANTTAHLVEDLEKIREHLGIRKWVLFGNSWGSTLALAYAQAHPKRVLGMVVSGIFLGTETEVDWMTRPEGLANLRPADFEALQTLFPGKPVGHKLTVAAYRAITGTHRRKATAVARTFARYESAACSANPDYVAIDGYLDTHSDLLKNAMIEMHFFAHRCFLKPGQLLENARKLRKIPITIIQGGLDFVCPPVAALRLHKALPNSTLVFVPEGTHNFSPTLEDARVDALGSLQKTLR